MRNIAPPHRFGEGKRKNAISISAPSGENCEAAASLKRRSGAQTARLLDESKSSLRDTTSATHRCCRAAAAFVRVCSAFSHIDTSAIQSDSRIRHAPQSVVVLLRVYPSSPMC